MISWRMAAAWVAALVAATVLTWQIVGLADSQVGEGPVAVAPTLEITPDQPDSSTSTMAVSSTAASTPTTTTPGPTTSTSADSPVPSTSSTVLSAWSLRSVSSPGGVVVVRYRPGEVELQAATPLPGFAVEIDDAGPPRVRVEFESADSDVRVEVRWKDGTLDIAVDAD
jgi:hypothetical protein